MFVLMRGNRTINTLGTNTRIYAVRVPETDTIVVHTGIWQLHSFKISESHLAQELVEAIFNALMEGKRGIDIADFLNDARQIRETENTRS